MIAVFGASVTQQKNGFAKKLMEYFNVPIRVFGYGGMHLNNAAICFMDVVIEQKPDYCFFDWFSTGYNEANDKTAEYIDTLLDKCKKVNCKPIFLFLPFRDNLYKKNFHRFCKLILNAKEVFSIDVSDELQKYEFDLILRDHIHTTEYGSSRYGKIIYDKFQENKDNLAMPASVSETQYSIIRRISINREFESFLALSGKCEIIGFLLTIGPHSGLVNVVNASGSFICNTWDRWCHYRRRHFNLPMRISGHAQVNILQDSFDTSSCEAQIDFNLKGKKLIVHDIYYVGISLALCNSSDGCRLSGNR